MVTAISIEDLPINVIPNIISKHHQWRYRVLGKHDTVAKLIKRLKETSKKMKEKIDLSAVEKNLLEEKIDSANKNLNRGFEPCHQWACGSSQDMWYGHQMDTLMFYKSHLPKWISRFNQMNLS